MPLSQELQDLAAGWRPQRPGRRPTRDIPDALVEPDWGGVRVVAAVAGEAAAFVRSGESVAVPDELAASVVGAFLAGDALIEGHLTTAALRTGEGVVPPAMTVERAPLLVPRLGRRDVKDDPFVRARDFELREDAAARPILDALARGERHAFVATDLLRVDGTSLADVPLLERKRLLEGVLETSFLVRVSPYVKPSAVLTLVTWGSQGFEELHWRAANSRYLAGAENPDHAVARPPEGPQGPGRPPAKGR